MIVETIQRNVTESHDFKSEIATIDSSEMRYISSLLRNNYSDTVRATVREIFANAIDANGTNSRPIELTAPTRLEPKFVVRDFGNGLSERDLFGLYTKYGRSTKRNDNLSIGGFGIGRFAPLSYTDSFTVESVHAGHKVVISVYVDEHGDTRFTKISDSQTTEPSGVEVSVSVKRDDIESFREKICQILSYSETTVITKNVNVEKITWQMKNERWGVSEETNANSDAQVIMGGIVYPLDFSVFSNDKISSNPVFINFRKPYIHQNFSFFFPVGSVSLHHSRESLEYNTITKNYIAKQILALEADVHAKVQSELDGIHDSALFFEKLHGLVGNGVASLCSQSKFVFTTSAGEKIAVDLATNSFSYKSCWKIGRTKNVARISSKYYNDSVNCSPTGFFSSPRKIAILVNDSPKFFSKIQFLLLKKEFSQINVVAPNFAKEKLLVDHTNSDRIFFASKTEGISKEKMQTLGNVRLIYDSSSYSSDLETKVECPDSEFFYVKLEKNPENTSNVNSSRCPKYLIKLNGKNLSTYEIRNLVESCHALGIKLQKIYAVIDTSILPACAIDLNKLFVEKAEQAAETHKATLVRNMTASLHCSELSNHDSYSRIAAHLPADHIIRVYADNCVSSDGDANFNRIAGAFNYIQIKFDEISSVQKEKITKNALTIQQKYPMLSLYLERAYYYSDKESLNNTIINYINLVDKNT